MFISFFCLLFRFSSSSLPFSILPSSSFLSPSFIIVFIFMASSGELFLTLPSFRHFSIALSLVLCSTLLLFTSSTTACNNQTLEECLGDECCKGNRLCLGRNTGNLLVSCPGENIRQCFCAPPTQFLDCSSDNECPEHEACAISGATGRQLCVGCRAIADEARNYTALNNTSDRCGKPRVPCGRTLDFCSENQPCVTRLQCVDRVRPDSPFLCGSSSTACRCEPPGGQQFFTPCLDGGESVCPVREACTFATPTNVNACLSCDTGRNDYFFRLTTSGFDNTNSVCNNLPSRDNPKYERSPNGLNYDLCLADVMCDGDRVCSEFRDDFFPESGTKPCSDINNLCFCEPRVSASACETSSSCPLGEACATVATIGVDRGCVSEALFETIPSNAYIRFDSDNATDPMDGLGVTGDTCRFDWDCRGERRCTHLTDVFGGCAGRRACTCEPLQRQVCSLDSECSLDEKCVNFIDGKTRPFCLSTRIVSGDASLQSDSFRPPTETPIPSQFSGLTGDPCRIHTDCAGQRSCQHANEVSGGCKGRALCFCQAQFNNSCTKTADCSDGEICTRVIDSCSPNSTTLPCQDTCLSEETFVVETPAFRERVV